MITPTWPAVRAELLDALQTNFAVLADGGHGADTHLRLGAPLRLGRTVPADGLPSAEPTFDDQLAEARALLGLDVVRRVRDVPNAELAASLRPDAAIYVVADAYYLPWTPYAGRRHRAHSFLVVGEGCGCRSTIIDAHHADTPWGRARPLRIPYAAAAVTAPRIDEVLWLEAGALAPAPAPRVEGLDPESVAAFLAPYRAALTGSSATGGDAVAAVDRLGQEARRLQRSRGLHAAYRGADRTGRVAEHLAEWARTTELLAVALREIRHGATPAAAVGALDRLDRTLNADATAFAGDSAPTAAAERPRQLPPRLSVSR